MAEQQAEPVIPQEARQKVLSLLNHDDWCDYGRGGSGCACSAGQALISLIAIEREAAVDGSAETLRAYFIERGWSIHLEDRPGQTLDPFADLAALGGSRHGVES